MFNFFKKVSKGNSKTNVVVEFNFELIGCALAYEVAKADGAIDINELNKIKTEIENKSNELGLNSEEVLLTIEKQSNESISFNDFINQINNNFSQDQKIQMIEFLWQTAFADNILDVDEERLIRRIADMIRIKDMKVLKLKDQAKNK
tara:strand:+ start:2120 stop:2560 length:441 start_codon:yes stop_codon:yes gene_type:complete